MSLRRPLEDESLVDESLVKKRKALSTVVVLPDDSQSLVVLGSHVEAQAPAAQAEEISKEEYQRVKNTILEVVQESLSRAQMPEESPLTPFKSRLPNGKFAIDLDDDSGPATGHPVVQKDKKGLISCLTCGTRMWLV